MNEDVLDETSPLNHVSQRSPSFSKEEVKTLIKLIDDYKSIILNKSTNSSNNHAKEITWVKIAKTFNCQGFGNMRSAENLRTKWDNIKKEARKMSKNLINVENNDLIGQVVLMLNETDKNSSIDNPEADADLSENETTKATFWDDDKISDHSNDGNNESKKKINRSLNFSPQECSLLLQCVKAEKHHVFSKETTGRAIKLKNNAWAKITHSFNKISQHKRTTKTLRNKLNNMKKLAKQAKNSNIKEILHSGHKKLEEEEESKDIKTEPLFEYAVDIESNSEISDNENEVNNECYNVPDIELDNPDPLSTVLNGDSGIGSISHFGSFNDTQDKEVVKLKLQLLKYQLETAKIKRQRIQEKMDSDRSERETKALEMSLRLRAARLEVVAAEGKLPPTHPALRYHHSESRISEYMQQFPNTLE